MLATPGDSCGALGHLERAGSIAQAFATERYSDIGIEIVRDAAGMLNHGVTLVPALPALTRASKSAGRRRTHRGEGMRRPSHAPARLNARDRGRDTAIRPASRVTSARWASAVIERNQRHTINLAAPTGSRVPRALDPDSRAATFWAARIITLRGAGRRLPLSWAREARLR